MMTVLFGRTWTRCREVQLDRFLASIVEDNEVIVFEREMGAWIIDGTVVKNHNVPLVSAERRPRTQHQQETTSHNERFGRSHGSSMRVAVSVAGRVPCTRVGVSAA